jgi:hypothetical protein
MASTEAIAGTYTAIIPLVKLCLITYIMYSASVAAK